MKNWNSEFEYLKNKSNLTLGYNSEYCNIIDFVNCIVESYQRFPNVLNDISLLHFNGDYETHFRIGTGWIRHPNLLDVNTTKSSHSNRKYTMCPSNVFLEYFNYGLNIKTIPPKKSRSVKDIMMDSKVSNKVWSEYAISISKNLEIDTSEFPSELTRNMYSLQNIITTILGVRKRFISKSSIRTDRQLSLLEPDNNINSFIVDTKSTKEIPYKKYHVEEIFYIFAIRDKLDILYEDVKYEGVSPYEIIYGMYDLTKANDIVTECVDALLKDGYSSINFREAICEILDEYFPDFTEYDIDEKMDLAFYTLLYIVAVKLNEETITLLLHSSAKDSETTYEMLTMFYKALGCRLALSPDNFEIWGDTYAFRFCDEK